MKSFCVCTASKTRREKFLCLHRVRNSPRGFFAKFSRLPFFAKHFFYALFRLYARDHDLMSAAAAFQLEVRAGTKHGKGVCSARVLLFHFKYVAYTNVHFLPSFPHCRKTKSVTHSLGRAPEKTGLSAVSGQNEPPLTDCLPCAVTYYGARNYILYYFIINLPVQTGAAVRRFLPEGKRIYDTMFSILQHSCKPCVSTGNLTSRANFVVEVIIP